jgi:WD40 repeat protein
MLILKGHTYGKPVRSLAFSPDGTRLASSGDWQSFLWDLTTGTHQVIDDRDSFCVAFSPDGKKVVTGRGRDLSIWDVETGQIQELDPHVSFIYGGYGAWQVAYSPDARILAGARDTVQMWDAQSLQPLKLGPGHDQATSCLAFTRDGKTLATGHQLRTVENVMGGQIIRLWDVASRRERARLPGTTGRPDALAFSPDGRFLAAAAGRTLWVWDVPASEVVVRHVISKQYFKDVAFSPDGRFLAFARNDATVSFWSTRDWHEVAVYDWKIGPMVSLAFAADGMRAAGGSGRGRIVIWGIDL